jgi:hypothetical protein
MSTPKTVILKGSLTEGEIALKICRHFGIRRQTDLGQLTVGDTTIYGDFDPQNRGYYEPKLKEIISEVVGPDWVSVHLDFSRGDPGVVQFLVDRLGGLDSDVIYAHLPKDFTFYRYYPDEYNLYADPAILDSIVQAIKTHVEELKEARRQNSPKKRQKRYPHEE